MNNTTTTKVQGLLSYVSMHELKDGAYKARVLAYEEITETEKSQAYVLVTLGLDGVIEKDRLYAARIPWVMKDLKAQFGLEYKDVALGNLLDHCKKHDFDVMVTKDAKFGTQFNYAKVETEE